MRITRLCLVALAVVMLSAKLTPAQVNWMSPLQKPGISLEMTKVSLAYPYDFSFWANQYRLSGKFFLGGNFYGIMEIPYVNLSYGDKYDCWYCEELDYSESTIGNPYLGIVMSKETSGATLRFGARLPFASRDNYNAVEYGILATSEYVETFAPRIVTFDASFGSAFKKPGEYSVSFQLGPAIMIPDEGDAELFADFSSEIWAEGKRVRAGIGYHFRYLMTESKLDFDESMEHQVAVSGAANLGSFHPGIHFRFPLDKSINQILKFTYGLNLTIDLPGSNATDSGF